MNIFSIEERDSTEHEVKHPSDGTPLGIHFELAGPEHPVRREHSLNVQRMARRKVARIKNPTIGKVLADSDPEEEEGQVTEFLVVCTLGWKGLEDEKGQPLPFSKESARKLYTDPKRAWLRRQVLGVLNDADAFIAGSPSS